ASFYLVTPVLDNGTAAFSDPTTSIYFLGGAAAVALCLALVFACWRPLLDEGRFWFVAVLLFATLLPISALTEGERYLYLPSAAFSILVGLAAARLAGRPRQAALAAAAVLIAVSA